MQEAITKQLLSTPNLLKNTHFSYYASKPLEQIHLDTMFFQPSGELIVEENKKSFIPVLVIADVCSRYIKAYVQPKKSELIKEHIKDFIKTLQEKYPRQTASHVLAITDGAREFAFKDFHDGMVIITHKVSTGINKAVMAEISIKQIRHYLRRVELKINLNNLQHKTNERIDRENLQDILDIILKTVNTKAYLHTVRPKKEDTPLLPIGTPVFLINLEKYFPMQTKSNLRKKSYDYNWYMEPYLVTEVFGIDNVRKYKLVSAVGLHYIQGSYYYDELQPINPQYCDAYIESYIDRFK